MSSLAGAGTITNPGGVVTRLVSEVTWINPGGQPVTVPVQLGLVVNPPGQGEPPGSVGDIRICTQPNNPNCSTDQNGNVVWSREFGEGPPSQRDVFSITGDESGFIGNIDPIQTFAVAFTDGGAASNVSFSLSSPLVPNFSGNIDLLGALSGSFSDGAADGGTASPWDPSLQNPTTATAIARFELGDGDGDPTNNPDVLGVGAFRTYAAIIDSQTDPVANGIFDCSTFGLGVCDTFGTTIGFTGSGGGDSYGFTSRFEVVPEPGTALLLGFGLLGIAAAGRRSIRPR